MQVPRPIKVDALRSALKDIEEAWSLVGSAGDELFFVSDDDYDDAEDDFAQGGTED